MFRRVCRHNEKRPSQRDWPPANPALPAKGYQVLLAIQCACSFSGGYQRGWGAKKVARLVARGNNRLVRLDESAGIVFSDAAFPHPHRSLGQPSVKASSLEFADRLVPEGTWLVDWACAHRCCVPAPALDGPKSF